VKFAGLVVVELRMSPRFVGHLNDKVFSNEEEIAPERFEAQLCPGPYMNPQDPQILSQHPVVTFPFVMISEKFAP
jgi:hypothetical protein